MQKETNFQRRKRRIRHGLRSNSQGKLRLNVHRTGKHIYAQIVDDAKGITLFSASSKDKVLGLTSGSTVEAARLVGKALGEKASSKGSIPIVFDRGGFLFHGRIKAIADGAREAGLKF